MKTSLATLALAAISALVLSACNGGSTASGAAVPLPNAATTSQHTRLHHLDNGSQDLHAGGADFVGYAYNLMEQPVGYYNQYQAPPGRGSLFYAAPTTGTVYYCIANSTDGRKAFEDNGDSGFPPTGACAALGSTITGFGGRQDPLDFVASATALPSTECCSGSSPYYQHRDVGSETWGQPFEFPQIGGLIGFPYRPQDFNTYVKQIKLSTWSYCAISNGTISNWNDPAITADNGKSVTGGTNETITYFFRSDSASTSYLLTNKLNTVCNQSWSAPYNKAPYEGGSRSAAWSFGVNSTWPGPGSSGDPNANFIGEQGSPGILAAIQTTPYSTGYMEGSYAKAADPHVGQAFLQNGFDKKEKQAIFVDPTSHTALVKALARVVASSIEYGMGSDGNSLGSSTPWCQLYIPYTAFVNPPAKTYPIVAVSYLLFYGQNNGVHLSDKQKLVNFLESKSANKIEAKFEYTGLSSSVESAVVSALNGNSSQASCLQ